MFYGVGCLREMPALIPANFRVRAQLQTINPRIVCFSSLPVALFFPSLVGWNYQLFSPLEEVPPTADSVG